MQIADDQVEWAVILRLRNMLVESRRAEYDVTLAFALFSSIILWIAQRMRTKDLDQNGHAARRFHQRMNRQRFGQIAHRDTDGEQSVASMIVLFRNAVAHADGCSVRPLCRSSSGGQPQLIGYAVRSTKDNRAGAIFSLTPDVMIRFGAWIADEFIADMTRDAQQTPHPDWADDVNRGVKEARR